MQDEEYSGYYCLMIAILCDLNADEARKMYNYGPDHPLCKKFLKKKVKKAGLKKMNRDESSTAMQELLTEGYSINAVAEAFQCFPSTVRRRVSSVKKQNEKEDGCV